MVIAAVVKTFPAYILGIGIGKTVFDFCKYLPAEFLLTHLGSN